MSPSGLTRVLPRPRTKDFIVHCRLALLGDLDVSASSRLAAAGERATDSMYSNVAQHAARSRRASTLANRYVPPLRRSVVDDLRSAFPGLNFVVNGGLGTVDEAAAQSHDVQVGRAVVNHPCSFSTVDHVFYGAPRNPRTRGDVLDAYVAYVESVQGTLPTPVARRRLLSPPYHLFAGEPGNGRYQRRIKKLAGTKLGKGCEAATILRAAKLEVADSLAKPIDDYLPLDDLPVYELESPRAGPLQRLVR